MQLMISNLARRELRLPFDLSFYDITADYNCEFTGTVSQAKFVAYWA